MLMILGMEGADSHTSRTFYKEMVQAVILFGVESWMVSPLIGRTLGGFHHRVARRLAKIQPERNRAGTQIYLPLDA